MAFKIISDLSTFNEAYERYPGTDAEAYVAGEALVQTNGKLTKCGATATPEFICIQNVAAATPAKQDIVVVRVTEEKEYTVVSTATVAATLIGQKVTIDATGLLVTATTASGVFLVSGTDGKTTNSTVRGYFRR